MKRINMNEKQAIKFLEKKGYEIKKDNFIKISELNIEVKIEKWEDTYENLLNNIPKGFRLMTCSEIFKIVELGLLNKITKEKDITIYLAQLPTDVKNNWSRMLYRDGDLDLGAGGGVLAGSDADGRVFFVRDLK